MAVIDIARTTPLDRVVRVEPLEGVAFTGERLAHKFTISATKNNQIVALSGSVTARVLRSNGTTVIMSGSVKNGSAEVTLAPDCYNVPGETSIVITVTENGSTVCVYGAVMTVRRSDSDSVVDSGKIIPSIDELLSKLDDMTAGTAAANNAASAANTAAGKANTSATNADTKAAAANSAASAANTAAGKANTAASNADSKAAAANTAASAANTAASTANTAATNADNKASLANTAAENADAKADAADKAAKAANTAKTNADTAAAAANAAAAAANTAKENADTATAAANEATEESKLRTQEARAALADMSDAISDAQDATDDALDAADAANAAKQAADTATTNAETATTAANTATTRANTAAGKLENITADSETLAPASQSTASVSEVNGHYHVHFGIPEGLKGDTGDDASISSQNTQYQNSASGTVIPSGAWLDEQPSTPQGQFLWIKVTLTWNNGESTVLYSVSRMGVDGSGSVVSVNEHSPDANGNVTLKGTDIEVSSSDSRTVSKAISDVADSVPTIDSALSKTSENPVQNKAIATELEAVSQRATNAETSASSAASSASTAASNAQAAAQDAQDVKDHAVPQIDETTQEWMLWDDTQQEYVATGISARGISGKDGAQGPKGETGPIATVTAQNAVYQTSTTDTEIPSGEWQSQRPTTQAGQYLWTKETLTWNNGTDTVFYTVSKMGSDGINSVQSVNGISPDQNKNVQLTSDDIAVSSTDATTIKEALQTIPQVDSSISSTSENPVQNKAIYAELDALNKRIGSVESPAQTAISIPFSIPVSAWTGSEGNYSATINSTSIAENSIVLTPNISSGFNYLQSEWAWVQVSGGVTFTVAKIPAGAIGGTIPVIDSVNGIVPVSRGGTGVGTLAEAKAAFGVSALETSVGNISDSIGIVPSGQTIQGQIASLNSNIEETVTPKLLQGVYVDQLQSKESKTYTIESSNHVALVFANEGNGAVVGWVVSFRSSSEIAAQLLTGENTSGTTITTQAKTFTIAQSGNKAKIKVVVF